MDAVTNLKPENTRRFQKTKKKNGSKNKLSIKGKQLTNKTDTITELDELEMLCLPSGIKRNSVQLANNTKIELPKNYIFKKDNDDRATDEDHRKFRNSKDLRQNVQRESMIEGMCFKQIQGTCVDPKCIYGHELRSPKKLILCNKWKVGYCTDGQFCLYLHAEYPCQFYYLGMQHDVNKCRYYHGGPLFKKLEEIFLDSIDRNRFPKATEMYQNRNMRMSTCRNGDVNMTSNDERRKGEISSATVIAEDNILPTCADVTNKKYNIHHESRVSSEDNPSYESRVEVPS